MRRSLQTAVVHCATIAFALTAAVGTAAANDGVSLTHLAPALGYTYTWVASESAVALTRPGLYVLVRSGNPIYDVNDAIETAAQAPQFRDNQMYIGAALASRLRALAVKYAPRVEHPATVAAGPPAEAPHGALTVAATPTTISDAVVVSGSGPANLPLTITLSADVARDLPRILLSRTNVVTDAAGNYSVQISTAPLHLQKSVVLVSATSVPGVSAAHVSFILGQPSPKIAHPLDETPRDFKPH